MTGASGGPKREVTLPDLDMGLADGAFPSNGPRGAL